MEQNQVPGVGACKGGCARSRDLCNNVDGAFIQNQLPTEIVKRMAGLCLKQRRTILRRRVLSFWET